ncbi:MAG: hypothetical protein R6X11_01610, partial [Desulfonatronovibrio sp.]
MNNLSSKDFFNTLLIFYKAEKIIFEKAFELIKIVESHGYIALIVGGAVRDFILQRPVKDVDLITDMPRDKIARLFKSYSIGKSGEFGLMSILYRQSHFDVMSIIPECREYEGQTDQNEKKRLMFLSNARQRDFTINAMAMDGQGFILDPLGGRLDIKKRMVRT